MYRGQSGVPIDLYGVGMHGCALIASGSSSWIVGTRWRCGSTKPGISVSPRGIRTTSVSGPAVFRTFLASPVCKMTPRESTETAPTTRSLGRCFMVRISPTKTCAGAESTPAGPAGGAADAIGGNEDPERVAASSSAVKSAIAPTAKSHRIRPCPDTRPHPAIDSGPYQRGEPLVPCYELLVLERSAHRSAQALIGENASSRRRPSSLRR